MALCPLAVCVLTSHSLATALPEGSLAGPAVFGGGMLVGAAVVTGLVRGRPWSRRRLSERVQPEPDQSDEPPADEAAETAPEPPEPAERRSEPTALPPEPTALPPEPTVRSPRGRRPGHPGAALGGLRIGVLGTLTINGLAGGLVPAQSQLILALALAGTSGLSNRQLCEQLGADPDHPKPADSLRQLIARTRRQLGQASDGREWIEHRGHGQYALHPDARVDCLEFDDLSASGISARDPALLTQALSRVRGEPFEQCYYWWIDPGMVEAVREQIVSAARVLAELSLAGSDPAAAARAARLGLAADPCAEQLWRILMRAEHAAGNLAGVREAWTRCRNTISDVAADGEPDAETTAVYDALVAP